MRELSPAELIATGDQFGIDVDDRKAAGLAEQVNEMLAGLEPLEIEPPAVGGPSPAEYDPGERSWRDPEPNPNNALSVTCTVPPIDGAGDRLAGLAVGLKDIIPVAGVPMECGSAVMRGYVPARDAVVVERLRAAGATITAKTNLDEFAGSARGTTGVGAPITNPHDETRTAGGSSGGSAAAVATGAVDVALGTDTGGSVRIPASFCGVVGLKPTYGRIPLTGIVENTYTQDHVGPMTTNVADAAALLGVLSGPDEGDPASMQAVGRDDYRRGDPIGAVADPPAPGELRVGLLREGIGDGVAPRIVDRTEAVTERLEDAGVEVVRLSIDGYHRSLAIKNALSFVELATHWRDGAAPYRRGGVDERYQAAFARHTRAASGELDDFYKSKLLAGAWLVEAHDGRPYVRAQAAREALREAFENALDGVDALLTPTMPDVAPRIEDSGDWEFDYARNTRPANVTRLPAVTLPGISASGLPVGLQLIGEAFRDDELLGVAETIESLLE